MDMPSVISHPMARRYAARASDTDTDMQSFAFTSQLAAATANMSNASPWASNAGSFASNLAPSVALSTTMAMNPASRKFTVTAPGSAYVIDGVSPNPTITVLSGHTYMFDLNNAGHPFVIRASSGGAAVTGAFVFVDKTTGVATTSTTSVAQTGGIMYWTVPIGQVSCVYQCAIHSGMVGTITVMAM